MSASNTTNLSPPGLQRIYKRGEVSYMELGQVSKRICHSDSLPDRRLGWTRNEWEQYLKDDERLRLQLWKRNGWITVEDWAKQEWEECGRRVRKAVSRMGFRPY